MNQLSLIALINGSFKVKPIKTYSDLRITEYNQLPKSVMLYEITRLIPNYTYKGLWRLFTVDNGITIFERVE